MSSPDFYRNTHAYDIAFGDRDFSAECDFLTWCLDTHGIGSTQPSFLEVPCGPARHAREFASRGWRSIGLDMSTDMLEYATQAANVEGVKLKTLCADMCAFSLDEPVCLIANMMESLTH